MTLEEWIKDKGPLADALKDLARASGVSVMTLGQVARGARMGNYRKAKAVSEATGGQVTIEELCE